MLGSFVHLRNTNHEICVFWNYFISHSACVVVDTHSASAVNQFFVRTEEPCRLVSFSSKTEKRFCTEEAEAVLTCLQCNFILISIGMCRKHFFFVEEEGEQHGGTTRAGFGREKGSGARKRDHVTMTRFYSWETDYGRGTTTGRSPTRKGLWERVWVRSNWAHRCLPVRRSFSNT